MQACGLIKVNDGKLSRRNKDGGLYIKKRNSINSTEKFRIRIWKSTFYMRVNKE